MAVLPLLGLLGTGVALNQMRKAGERKEIDKIAHHARAGSQIAM